MSTPGLALGLDGGGSSSAVVVHGPGGHVRFARGGGPLNVSALATPLWAAELDRLLDGCPEPAVAMVCVSGMRSASARAAVRSRLRARFPVADLVLEPDVVAALGCFAEPVTACVVAGTGSIVASHDVAVRLVTTGGTGYAEDPGSAYRLGARTLAHRGDDAHLGAPATIAALAPQLTIAAERGDPWAVDALDEEMDALARQAAEHLAAHHPDVDRPLVGLVGGVWKSAVAVVAFERALRARANHASTCRATRSAVDAAVLLAAGRCS